MSDFISNNLQRAARLFPGVVWSRLERRAKGEGVSKFSVILSFDADTDEDAGAADRLFKELRSRNIKGTLAVPGEQLKRGAAVYRELAGQGARFINHGYLPHTEFRNGRYESVTFYAKMDEAEIEQDISRGHQTIVEVTGQKPAGFRTPHFGHFQNPDQLALIHRLLKKFGYLYSTSTLPVHGFLKGPLSKTDGLFEFSHAGSFSKPLTILDSWSFVASRGKTDGGSEYSRVVLKTLESLRARNFSGILNLYADPKDIAGNSDYLRVLDFIGQNGIETFLFEDLLRTLSCAE